MRKVSNQLWGERGEREGETLIFEVIRRGELSSSETGCKWRLVGGGGFEGGMMIEGKCKIFFRGLEFWGGGFIRASLLFALKFFFHM